MKCPQFAPKRATRICIRARRQSVFFSCSVHPDTLPEAARQGCQSSGLAGKRAATAGRPSPDTYDSTAQAYIQNNGCRERTDSKDRTKYIRHSDTHALYRHRNPGALLNTRRVSEQNVLNTSLIILGQIYRSSIPSVITCYFLVGRFMIRCRFDV